MRKTAKTQIVGAFRIPECRKSVQKQGRMLPLDFEGQEINWCLEEEVHSYLQGILAVLVLCNIMRCLAMLILYGFVCSSGKKSSDDLHMAIHWRQMEGGPTIPILDVYISSCLDQQINHLEVSIPWCMNEWGDTICISSVDICPFGNEEFRQ